MQSEKVGKLIGSAGGLYEIFCEKESTTFYARAKGAFRHEGESPLVGDNVHLLLEEGGGGEDGGGAVIAEILPRKNALIRPPMANLEYLLIAFAAAKPAPVTETIDKLIAIAEYNDIEPIPVISKCDTDPDKAKELTEIYRKAGFHCFSVSAETGEGVKELTDYLKEILSGKTAAIAGASGVGKSTLLNLLCPQLHLETGEISRKTERGRHTTRKVEFHAAFGGYLADTPGFSLLDFVHFDFFGREDLPYLMREFRPYIGQCRYTKCSHTKEEGCAVLEALKKGEIAPSRHAGFLSMYEDLKNKHDWSKK